MTFEVRTEQSVITLLGWPTDIFSVNHHFLVNSTFAETKAQSSTTAALQRHARANESSSKLGPPPVVPHTVLIFIAGNPGVIDWYIPFFVDMIKVLGPGFAARGVANAGHSLDPDRLDVANSKSNGNRSIPWTVDGQVKHKVAFLDHVTMELQELCQPQALIKSDFPCFVMISHSVGAHFTQSLCLLRPDLLKRMKLLIHLMPFICMNAPQPKQTILNVVSRYPTQMAALHSKIIAVFACLPLTVADFLLRCAMSHDDEARKITLTLLRQPALAENFFRLGCEEIRDIPKVFDSYAMRVIGKEAMTVMLFAGNDQWSPKFHIDDLTVLQRNGMVPFNVSVVYMPQLKHDFITQKQQTKVVVQFCVKEILKVVGTMQRSHL